MTREEIFEEVGKVSNRLCFLGTEQSLEKNEETKRLYDQPIKELETRLTELKANPLYRSS